MSDIDEEIADLDQRFWALVASDPEAPELGELRARLSLLRQERLARQLADEEARQAAQP